MGIKKGFSYFIIIVFLSFLCTSARFFPQIRVEKNAFLKAVLVTTKTILNLNKIYTDMTLSLVTGQNRNNNTNNGPEGKTKNGKFFQFLLLSVFTAVLIPAAVKLAKPYVLKTYPIFLKKYLSIIMTDLPPPGSLAVLHCRVPILSGQNNSRERRDKKSSDSIQNLEVVKQDESDAVEAHLRVSVYFSSRITKSKSFVFCLPTVQRGVIKND